jgi:hypothetical protein
MIAESQAVKPDTGLRGRLSKRWSAEEVPVSLAVPCLTVAFVAPVIIAALIMDEPSAAFWGVLVLDLVALYAFAVATYTRPTLFIGVLVLWFALQRLVVAVAAPEVSPDMVRLLLTYKEGYYFILPAAAITALYLRARRGEAALSPLLLADVAAVTWLGLLAVHFVAAGDPSTPELTYARRFSAPLLLYAGGRLLLPALGELRSSLGLVAGIAVAVAVAGLIERFALGVGFWSETVDAAAFYGKQVESGLLPENWTVIYRGVPDGIFISLPLETPVRRLVSTYLEPTTLGSFLAFALLLVLLAPGLGAEPGRVQRRLAAVAVVVLAVALLATLSRGGMLAVLAGGALFVAVRALQGRESLQRLPLLTGSVVAVVMAIGVGITSLRQFPGDSHVRDLLETRAVSGLSNEPAAQPGNTSHPAPPGTQVEDAEPPDEGPLREIDLHPPGSTAEGASKHLDGLESGLNKMLDEPLGAGLGAAGNWSDSPEAGGESAVGVVAAQTGLPGLLAYVSFYAAAIGGLVAVAWRTRGAQGDLSLVLAGALFGLFIVSFVSESAFGLLGNAPYFIFAGWMLALAARPARRLRFRAFPVGDVAGEALDPSEEDRDTISR